MKKTVGTVLVVIAILWALVFVLTGMSYPIPAIGMWNLIVALLLAVVGLAVRAFGKSAAAQS